MGEMSLKGLWETVIGPQLRDLPGARQAG